MTVLAEHGLTLEAMVELPDLAGLRESAELDKMTADERQDCFSLRRDVDEVRTLASGRR
jgi:hypothetical protein